MNDPRLLILFGHQQQPASEARLRALWRQSVATTEQDSATVKCDRGHVYNQSMTRCPDCWNQRDRHLTEW